MFLRKPGNTLKRNNWLDITFVPGQQVVDEAIAAWKWLIPDPWNLLLCSMFGDIFRTPFRRRVLAGVCDRRYHAGCEQRR